MSADSFYQSLVQEALICGRCGNCRDACPVYRELGWESAAPRAKISLARELFSLGREQAINPAYAKRITQCTLCGACTRACAARIDLQAFWQELRAKLLTAGQAPIAYNRMLENLHSRKNISPFDNESRLDWAEELDQVPEQLDQQPGAEVAYFVGCVSSFFPRAAQVPLAMVKLLQKSGVSFTTLGPEEWCCGFPLLAAGATAEIEPYIRHNIDCVRELGVTTVITGCSSCYHVWQHVYPQVLGEELGFRLLHSVEYLDELLTQGRLQPHELPKTVTYHDPCDLGRNSGVIAAPRRVLQSIPGLTFSEMATNGLGATCCGGGGNLQAADPVLADAIAGKRMSEAAQTGADIVVSACQQCEQMLEKAARAAKYPIEVMDLAELLWLAVEDGEEGVESHER